LGIRARIIAFWYLWTGYVVSGRSMSGSDRVLEGVSRAGGFSRLDLAGEDCVSCMSFELCLTNRGKH
jgi:hypothetical protein